MATLFTKIVNGELPCFKIAEDADHLAFLDLRPIRLGHTLVIPKKESDYIFDMAPTDLEALMGFVQKVAKAIDKAIACKRVGVMVAGLEVPHTHVHLVPMNQVTDLNFELVQPADDEDLQNIAIKIRDAF